MILLIDNYDSFSYNLYQLIGEISSDIRVIRNDELTVQEIRELHPEGIILSPGPGRPEQAGVIVDVARDLGKEIPILGVCLGHQAICYSFGAEITYAKKLMHGKQSRVRFRTQTPLFQGLDEIGEVARYHSLAASGEGFPEELMITAVTEKEKEGDQEEIMAVQHREYPIFGVQFHPESILTPQGKEMLVNFIAFCKQKAETCN